jgi:hypothetical protein
MQRRNRQLSYSAARSLLHAGFAVLLLFAFTTTLASGQSLPDKIRGYKVHSEPITVEVPASSGKSAPKHADVSIGEAEVSDIALDGVYIKIPVEFSILDQSGRVDFLTFHDFKVNGIQIDVPEYRMRFEFRKGRMTKLPAPAVLRVPASSVARTAWQEVRDSKAIWTVTGRVFVFGRFRKWGVYHKRVVPVDIVLYIPNPLGS